MPNNKVTMKVTADWKVSEIIVGEEDVWVTIEMQFDWGSLGTRIERNTYRLCGIENLSDPDAFVTELRDELEKVGRYGE